MGTKRTESYSYKKYPLFGGTPRTVTVTRTKRK